MIMRHCNSESTPCFHLKAERDGSNEYQNFQPASLNTTDAVIRDLDNTDIVFHIGDISYANGYLSQWDQFTQQVEPITSRVPYMLARYACSFRSKQEFRGNIS
jgi:hypothetical protein